MTPLPRRTRQPATRWAWLLAVLLLAGAGWQPALAQAAAVAAASGAASATADLRTAAATPAAAASGFDIRPVDDAWRAALPLDAEAATQAYLDRLPAQAVARSNAYFEGGYWLRLWNWLAGVAVAAALLFTPWSTALRDWAQRRLRWAPLRDAFYGAAFVAVATLMTLPLDLYQSFFREHQYGMSTQTLPAWLGEAAIGLAVSMVAAGLGVAVLYAVLRRAGAQWWLWGTGVSMAGLVLMVAVAPVFVEPLFNTYRPMPESPVKSAVLTMARANGVPVDDVLVFDASRQTTRVSANVSGLFGTAAVRLNDNLLNRTSPAEIRAVMGHEIGHYAMNHIPKMLVMFGAVVMAGFLFAQWAMAALLRRLGPRWHLRGVGDVASLPLLTAVFSTYLLLATPVINTITRTQEIEADLWGLNLAREPHGMAEVLLKLVEYRKPEPTALEEAIFYTHPSARRRIHAAMTWREQMAGRAAN